MRVVFQSSACWAASTVGTNHSTRQKPQLDLFSCSDKDKWSSQGSSNNPDSNSSMGALGARGCQSTQVIQKECKKLSTYIGTDGFENYNSVNLSFLSLIQIPLRFQAFEKIPCSPSMMQQLGIYRIEFLARPNQLYFQLHIIKNSKDNFRAENTTDLVFLTKTSR